MHDSDHVMTCTTAIISMSNMIKKLLLQCNLNSSYNQEKYIGEDEIIHNIFRTYVEPLLNYINHFALVQERKLYLDAPAYDKKLMLT